MRRPSLYDQAILANAVSPDPRPDPSPDPRPDPRPGPGTTATAAVETIDNDRAGLLLVAGVLR